MGKYYAYASEYIPELKRARPIFLHQFIMEANGKTVDHKNNNCLDNRKENLRIVLDTNNSKNRRGRNSNNKSGYRNVSWSNTEKMWIVQLQINKKKYRGHAPKFTWLKSSDEDVWDDVEEADSLMP